MARESAKKRAVRGLLMKIVGIIVAAGGFVAVVWIHDQPGFGAVVGMTVGVTAFFYLGPKIWRYGLRVASPDAETVLKNDHRPPILYFRSFSQEEEAHRFWKVLGYANSWPILPGYSPWPPMEQYQFNKLMNRLGPYIAIGRPGELLPEIGAARLYVSDEEWQDKVSLLLEKARFVVIRAGASPGLEWEIKQVVDRLPPTRILLITPPKKRDYEAFRSWFSKLLPKPLPKKLGEFTRLITFAIDGTPVPLDYHGKTKDEQVLAPFLSANGIRLPEKTLFSNLLKH